jgi:hypothetical protein
MLIETKGTMMVRSRKIILGLVVIAFWPSVGTAKEAREPSLNRLADYVRQGGDDGKVIKGRRCNPELQSCGRWMSARAGGRIIEIIDVFSMKGKKIDRAICVVSDDLMEKHCATTISHTEGYYRVDAKGEFHEIGGQH